MKLNLGRGWWVTVVLACAAAMSARAQTGATAESGKELVDGDPLISHWVAPEYPAELKAQKVQGRVTVQMVIDETGKMSNLRVTKSTDPRFNDAVLKALQACEFKPALEAGKPVAASAELNWDYTLPYHPPKDQPPLDEPLHGLPKTPAVAESSPDPVYPPSLIERHLDGQVLIDLEIGVDGQVSDFRVRDASHPDFVAPAVEAVKQWKFKPARRGDLPVKDVKRAPLSFYYQGLVAADQRTPLEANGFALDVPEGSTAKSICDHEPEILSIADPVFPVELLSGDKPGEAEVSFTLSMQGFPEDVTVKSASHPACGSSLVAAVQASVFKPALLNGQTVAVKLIRKQQFLLPADTPEKDEPAEIRLLRARRAGEKIPGARGLDASLVPLWRAMPKYPPTLGTEKPQGSAVIEVIIDKTGRARVPKIVSATRDEFGWSAATALGQWVFAPAFRGGQPVEVRAQVPVQFAPP